MSGSHRWKYCLAVLPTLLVVTSACNRPMTATDLTVERMEQTRWISQPNFTYMVDNAILHDMSIADVHFVPHTYELSGTGTAKLERMAYLLNAYGGTVRYETLATDEKMIQQRLDRVCEYLALAGCNMDRVEVMAMLSGGRGMPADEAIEIKEKGTVRATDSASGGQSLMGAMGGL